MGQLEKDFKKSFCWRPNLESLSFAHTANGKRQIKVDSFSKGRK